MNFRNWVLQNFPILEDDFDALTDYELFMKVAGFVIGYSKDNEEMKATISEFIKLFNELKTHVDDYFTNLDVQQEINNKLDAMAEDGTLTNLIKNYVNPFIDEQNQIIEGQNETIQKQNENISGFITQVNNTIASQNQQIASIEGSSPLIVSSTSEMSDTSKIYILSSNMHIYVYSVATSTFTDTNLVYGQDVNALTGVTQVLATAASWENYNNDYNNLLGNKIYAIFSNKEEVYSQLVHGPKGDGVMFQGLIVSLTQNINASTSQTTLCQLAISHTSSTEYYFRMKWGANWREWRKIYSDTELLALLQNVMDGYATILSTAERWGVFQNDYNNLIGNKIYFANASSEVNANLVHGPKGDGVSFLGTVISMTYNNQATPSQNMLIQIAIASTSELFYRFQWGSTWRDWKKIYNDTQINTLIENAITSSLNRELYKCFDIVGVIGDSLASGECAYHDSNDEIHYVDMFSKSWGQFMARDSNNTYYNFSKGGLSTRSWFTDSHGYASAIKSPCKAYIIGLGVNDANKLGNAYLGTIDDIDVNDYTNNADTFYGNYAKIIQTMKVVQPKAKFFLITIPEIKTSYNNFNTAIRNICNLFDNCYLLDLVNTYYEEFNNGFIKDNLRSGHYNAIAYEYIAKIIETSISKLMYDNYQEFEQVEFIGTDYEW